MSGEGFAFFRYVALVHDTDNAYYPLHSSWLYAHYRWLWEARNS